MSKVYRILEALALFASTFPIVWILLAIISIMLNDSTNHSTIQIILSHEIFAISAPILFWSAPVLIVAGLSLNLFQRYTQMGKPRWVLLILSLLCWLLYGLMKILVSFFPN